MVLILLLALAQFWFVPCGSRALARAGLQNSSAHNLALLCGVAQIAFAVFVVVQSSSVT